MTSFPRFHDSDRLFLEFILYSWYWCAAGAVAHRFFLFRFDLIILIIVDCVLFFLFGFDSRT